MNRKVEENKVRHQLPRFFFLFNLITIAAILLMFFYLIAYSHIHQFREEKKELRNQLLAEKKDALQKEVNKAARYINFTIDNSDEHLKKMLIERVENAYRIAHHIYQKNKAQYSNERILELIKDALRPMRYDEGRGYIFITRLDGQEILYPVMPHLEGKNLINVLDDSGAPLLEREIKLAKNEGRGFITGYWRVPKMDTTRLYEKLSYIISFPELNCMIGSGEYLAFFKNKEKAKTLKWLSQLRFGKEGYIFVNTYQGDALVKDGLIVSPSVNIWELEDPYGVKVIQEERKAAKNKDGDFIFYQWRKLNSSKVAPKMSFIKGIDRWQWMIGAGTYIDDIETTLAQKEKELKISLRKDATLMIAVMVILAIILFSFSLFYTKRLKQNMATFFDFFDQAHKNYKPIDLSQIHFKEFKRIANAGNDLIARLLKSEEQQKAEALYFERLFESAPEAIALVDKELNIIKVNHRFYDLFGYTQQEISGKKLIGLIIPQNTHSYWKNYLTQLREGKEVTFEEYRKHKEGHLIQVAIHATPIMQSNGNIQNYVIYRDITQQKQFEEELDYARRKAEESDRLKSAFLANISHEIRTPMNAILGFSSLLSGKDVSKQTREEYIRIISQSGSNLLSIIDNILDFAKIEAENLSIVRKTTDVYELIKHLQKYGADLIKQSQKKQLEIICHPIEAPIEIFVDKKRLKQILENLVSNAIKFSEKGTIEVGIQLSGDKNITFYVKDQGIGISEKEQMFIFDRFRQLDDDTTRKYGGTGLGLALCKSIVNLMEGSLWVESQPQKGSTFYVSLPLLKSPEPAVYMKPKEDISKHQWPDKNILIAEDNINNYEYLKNALSTTESKILWAKNGKEAIDMVKSHKIDLLLMDINMPVMDGNSALRQIRNLFPNLPVIAQTAYAMTDEIHQLKAMGYDDLLIKPIGIKELIHKIAVFMDE